MSSDLATAMLDLLTEEYLADIDAEPFAHEQYWTAFVGDIREERAP